MTRTGFLAFAVPGFSPPVWPPQVSGLRRTRVWPRPSGLQGFPSLRDTRVWPAFLASRVFSGLRYTRVWPRLSGLQGYAGLRTLEILDSSILLTATTIGPDCFQRPASWTRPYCQPWPPSDPTLFRDETPGLCHPPDFHCHWTSAESDVWTPGLRHLSGFSGLRA